MPELEAPQIWDAVDVPMEAEEELPLALGVLISGSGTNLQAVIDAIAAGTLDARITVVISNKEAAYGLERARHAGITAVHIDPAKHGDIVGEPFGSPDGLHVDRDGRVWICTDVSPSKLQRGDYALIGNNQLLCADPASREVRRFLVGPRGCEITGALVTPDGSALFVNVQHPGESGDGDGDPDQPRRISNWPDYRADGRPRSATLVVTRRDGGRVGT
jgi:secreted PhoX family phosphatase